MGAAIGKCWAGPKAHKSAPQKLEELTAPDPADVAQVKAYANDILAQFPEYSIRTAVCVVQGRAGFRWFDVESAQPTGLGALLQESALNL